VNYNRLGLLGFVFLVIAVTGAWHLLVRTWAERHPDQIIAQAAARAW
jgi:hypothetical protein